MTGLQMSPHMKAPSMRWQNFANNHSRMWLWKELDELFFFWSLVISAAGTLRDAKVAHVKLHRREQRLNLSNLSAFQSEAPAFVHLALSSPPKPEQKFTPHQLSAFRMEQQVKMCCLSCASLMPHLVLRNTVTAFW